MTQTPAKPGDNLVDLVAERFGGSVIATNDEFFAPASRMLLLAEPIAAPGVYTEHGVWTDGWESRRRRVLPGSDWAILRTGAPGVVRAVTVDTTHYTGNAPQSVELFGAAFDGYPSAGEVAAEDVEWVPIVERTPVTSDAVNEVAVVEGSDSRITHVKLVIHPDGGVARLRLRGEVVADPRRFDRTSVDLAAAELGGVIVACSDMHYGDRHSLNHPGDARVMGEGWETRRRRGPGHDWAVARLATAGRVAVAEVDTRHFKGNAPREVALWGLFAPGLADAAFDTGGLDGGNDVAGAGLDWRPLLPVTRVQPDTRHLFDLDAADLDLGSVTHVRVDAIPDGGLARLRLWGAPSAGGREALGVRWLDALPRGAAAAELLTCCSSWPWAAAVAGRRPFGSLETLLAVAEEEWLGLGPEAWLESFAGHPRIGERGGAREAAEQAAALAAGDDVTAALAAGNREYEERFGHIFLVRAAGRGAAEILGLLRERLANDPDTELRVAAGQQAEITALRLRALIGGPTP